MSPPAVGSGEHQVVQPGDVLHHQRVPPARVPVPLGRDPPHLHLPDPVLDHDPPPRHPPVPGLLPGRQLPLRRLAASGSPAPSPGTPCPPSASPPAGTPPASGRTPSCRASCPGNASDTAAIRTRRRLAPGPGGFRFRDDHHLVLERVPLLLPRVEPLLPPRRPGDRPLGGVEEQLADLVRARVRTRRSGMRKMPASSGWSGLMLRPTADVVDAEQEAEEGVGGVRPVVHQEHQQAVGQGEGVLPPGPGLPLARSVGSCAWRRPAR